MSSNSNSTNPTDHYDNLLGGLVLLLDTTDPAHIDAEKHTKNPRKERECAQMHIAITKCDWKPPMHFYNAMIVPERMGTSDNPYRPRRRYIKVHEPGKCKCRAARVAGRAEDESDVAGRSEGERKKLRDVVAVLGKDGPGGTTKEDSELFPVMLDWQAELVK